MSVVSVVCVVRLTWATVRLSVRDELPAARPTSGNAVVLEFDTSNAPTGLGVEAVMGT